MRSIFYAILTGLLLTLSFPKIDLSWIAWFCLIPLLLSISCQQSSWLSFRAGWLAGMIHYLTLLYWLTPSLYKYSGLSLINSILILLLLCAYLSCYPGLFALFANKINLNSYLIILLPVCWTGLEYFRSLSGFGFPWGLIGYTQYKQIYLIQISDIFGVYGVSFMLVFANICLYKLVLYFWQKNRTNSENKTILIISIFTILFASTFIYGFLKIKNLNKDMSNNPSFNISLVQGNIDQSQKWNPNKKLNTVKKYMDLSLKSNELHPDLIVWPETALPFYYLREKGLKEYIRKKIRKSGACFLVGSPSISYRFAKKKYFNTAYLIMSDGTISDKYYKVHLLPYGEYIPFRSIFPFLNRLVHAEADFNHGDKLNLLKFKDIKLGVQICYEVIFPNYSRIMALNGAGLIINLTNDAWFGMTSAPYQHFSMAIFRSIENRRFLARCANSGISCFIDPAGRVINKTELFKTTYLNGRVKILNKITFYSYYGDIFAISCLLFILLYSLWKIIYYLYNYTMIKFGVKNECTKNY